MPDEKWIEASAMETWRFAMEERIEKLESQVNPMIEETFPAIDKVLAILLKANPTNVACKKCKSTHIEREYPAAFNRIGWKCLDCGYRWMYDSLIKDKPTIKVPENLSELTPTEILEAARKEIEEKPKDSEAICFNCEQFCVDDPLCPNLMVKKLAQVNLKPKDSEDTIKEITHELNELYKINANNVKEIERLKSWQHEARKIAIAHTDEIDRLKSELEKCNQANQIWWTEEERKLSNIIEKALEYLKSNISINIPFYEFYEKMKEILEGKS